MVEKLFYKIKHLLTCDRFNVAQWLMLTVSILQVLVLWFRDSRFETSKRVAAVSDKANRLKSYG